MMDSDDGSEEMKEQLNQLEDAEFQALFSRLMQEMDFSVKSSRKSGDHILVEAKRKTSAEEALDYVVGVKRGDVGPEDIQELVHQKKDFNGMFVSTEAFSEDAQTYGEAMDVELVGGSDLIRLLRKFSLLGDIQRMYDVDMLETESARFLPSIGELESLMDAAMNALRRGNLDFAMVHTMKAIMLKPNYDLAWALKARISEKMGHPEEALDAYKKALFCNVSDVDLWLGLGLVLFNLERHEEELEAYDQAIKIDENFTKAWLNKGATLHKLERYDEAVECYDEVLKKDPKNAMILNNKAVALKALGKNDEALTFYGKAVKADPEFLDARKNKLILLEETGKKRDAVKELDAIVELTPGVAGMWFLKGSIHLDLKQKKQAVASFEKVLELDPKFEDAKKMLNRSKRLRVKKKISKDDYPCFGDYE
ncbi:MAG: tetratricopeptide repeat protein, partial [Thermoplasmata archaeon]|nr:tetratricopeptide repeat protein [Thermoplasmata archaeon]